MRAGSAVSSRATPAAVRLKVLSSMSSNKRKLKSTEGLFGDVNQMTGMSRGCESLIRCTSIVKVSIARAVTLCSPAFAR